jgi:hypothetical protein
MPTNKPFFPNLRPVKKVVTPQGEVLTHISEMKSFQRACECYLSSVFVRV